MSEWIPVTERLPELRKPVLVVDSDGDVYVASWAYSLLQRTWMVGHCYCELDNDVTHWMPLPEPPKP